MSRRAAFGQLILARIREFYREPEAVFWVYGFPLILAVMLGLGVSGGDTKPPEVDIERSASESVVRGLEKKLRAAGFKNVQVGTAAECRQRLRIGQTALVIVPGGKQLVYVYDKTRSDAIRARYWVDSVLARDELGESAPKPKEEFVTEPGSRYIDFLVPSLIGMNLMGGGLFGIGFVLVDMRVRKLFKRLLATPMNRPDFLLALFVSRLVFLIPEMAALFALALLWRVPVNGSPLTLAVIILVGTAAFDGIGLLIASRTDKTETVSGLINLTMLPMYLLSGTFFSSKHFPEPMQPFIQALPLTQVNDSLREVMLEGHALTDIAWRLGILAAWAVVTFFLALKWFKWR